MYGQKQKLSSGHSGSLCRMPARRLPSLPASRVTEQSQCGVFSVALKGSLGGLIGFVATGLLLITAACAIAYSSNDPSALIAPLALGALLLSAFVGGFVTCKLTRRAPMLCGVIFGALCTLVMLALCLVLSGAPASHYTFFQGLMLHAFLVLFSVLGAFTGTVKRKPDPHKRRFGN